MSFKPRNKTEARLHEAWIGHCCDPVMSERCPQCDLRKHGGWPINRAFCKATGKDVSCMDFESQCPRHDELAWLRHEENVQRHKARAAARRAKLAVMDTADIPTEVEEGMRA